ncbi:hypothetical protein [Desulfonatronospira sp.]|uniref:hypothetical protein n=1 Tax=Desulfonatronospira sp. TaxID=1962951 RepID=UPI0025BD4BA1|nr:hypothetical protein [Desulfonatronospira sp.]
MNDEIMAQYRLMTANLEDLAKAGLRNTALYDEIEAAVENMRQYMPDPKPSSFRNHSGGCRNRPGDGPEARDSPRAKP